MENYSVDNFLDGLQAGGFWDEMCVTCGKFFSDPEGEEVCDECQEEEE